MKLDGKKKFLATVTAIVASGLALFFTPEQVGDITQTIAVASPLVLGFVYDWLQQKHDVKKEELKIEHEKTEQAKASGVTLRQSEVLEEVEAEIFYEPFDQEAFERKVIARAKSAYFVDNPLTQFQAARDKALIAPCKNVDKARSYWYYYIKKGLAAFEFLFGFPHGEANDHLLVKNEAGKMCTVPDLDFLAIELGEGHYKLLEALKAAQRNLGYVSQLEQNMVAWVHPQSNEPQRWTLWTLGTRAKEILSHA